MLQVHVPGEPVSWDEGLIGLLARVVLAIVSEAGRCWQTVGSEVNRTLWRQQILVLYSFVDLLMANSGYRI